MPRRSQATSLILFSITPRFEVFYALQTLAAEDRAGYTRWKRETLRKLPRGLKQSLQRIGPAPLFWPLLADAFRDAAPMIQYGAMIDELRLMDDAVFQRAVLGGVFKASGSVDNLVSGSASVAEAVSAEPASQKALLTMLGLLPFRATHQSARAMARIVDEPEQYRVELADSLKGFWDSTFGDTWAEMKPRMLEVGDRFEEMLSNSSLEEFSRLMQLPIVLGSDSVTSTRGTMSVALRHVDGIHIIPSAFNAGRFWAAYTGDSGRTQFFIPTLDPALSPTDVEAAPPSLVFKALGDTTRYAMASMIAHTPMTSVDLARAFQVSKPTISHHVQLLRAAQLLREESTENGVLLSLDRAALERASSDAAIEMFSTTRAAPEVRRTRK